jgi:hypothetical protein
MRYSATFENKIIVDNTIHQPKEYTSIQMVNIGDCDALINDNIPLAPGDSWEWLNHPSVIIDQATNVRFTGSGTDQRILVQMFFNKEVK